MHADRGIGLFASCQDVVDIDLLQQIFARSNQLQQRIPPYLQHERIDYFFEGPAQMFPIVFRDQFMQHRNMYYCSETFPLPFGFSPSLEHIILAIASDPFDDELADELAANAKTLVELERRANWVTLGSIQACILIGWREGGSKQAGHYSAMASELTAMFGMKFDDPFDCTSDSDMQDDEVNTRRAICWGLLIFDK
jgi:hypothetical protein